MVINSMKIGQIFEETFTAENGGVISTDILPTVKYIKVVKHGIPTSGSDFGFEAYSGEFGVPTIFVGGASGAITLTKKALGVISAGTKSITLTAGKVTKTAGLEIDFVGFATPKVGDVVMLTPAKRVAGDDYLVNRALFVLSVTGTKAKLMSEVPSAMAIDATDVIYAKVSAMHGKQDQLKYGIDVTSTSRAGSLVTLKGSHSKLIGMQDALGGLKIDEDSDLLVPMKKKSGQQKHFQIISMKEGSIVVSDPDGFIATTALGTKVIGTAHVVAVGGYTLISAITTELAGASRAVAIDLTKLAGAAAGDKFTIEARYGGEV